MLGDLVEDEDDEGPFKEEVYISCVYLIGKHQGVLIQKLYSQHKPEPKRETVLTNNLICSKPWSASGCQSSMTNY